MRKPCCDKRDTNKGAWSKQEDEKLQNYIRKHGEAGCWRTLPRAAGWFLPFHCIRYPIIQIKDESYMLIFCVVLDWFNNLGLLRCGKSCRLIWINYLRPDLKRRNFGEDEDDLIIKLHALLGNR